MRPTRARIELARLRANAALAAEKAPDSRLMAVLKADGYGHGAVAVAQALAATADAFAVATLDEAVTLREAGIRQPVLLLEGPFEPSELEEIQARELTVTITGPEQLAWVEAARLRGPVACWLKLDTGMHRLGLDPARAREAWERLDASANADLQAACTHFARAEELDRPETGRQLERFLAATRDLPLALSAANSPAVLARPETHLDWIRPGYLLYGDTPLPREHPAGAGLAAVMQFESAVIAVREIPAGDAVGYGGSWVAERPSRIATIAAGYGDGYPRTTANGTPVLVKGRRAPLAGRVSMDMLTVDVTDLPPVQVGDPVRLWGDDLPVGEVARGSGTTGYELLAGMPARTPRVYT
ncbi:alanine racemase [Pseudohaliea rubra]|uniref:Alanine racemase n=1 Tax=Pseudohaliea rubra DSM 19751 TaxID=1265313 RepID=A0A095X1Z9_9GAMM|nr:alanine racemase [Pseudohaliea rubra]KGE04909.1 Alanine racemase [Pseudohaliea rubra DSM 19751]